MLSFENLFSRLMTVLVAFALLLNGCEKSIDSFPEHEPEQETGSYANVFIPDPVFLNRLIRLGVDSNGDSLISYAEAAVVRELDLCRSCTAGYLEPFIINLTGIEAFTNLQSLKCNWNKIKRLDISKCTALEYLDCRGNPLIQMDVSSNTALSYLSCGGMFKHLDISENTALTTLCVRNMPRLEEVCVWTIPFPPDSVEVINVCSPNVSFTMNCDF
jgi:hypothetical protein